jgi:hypothetical protein
MHPIKTALYRREPFLCSGGIVIFLLRRQAANEMVLLGMLVGVAHEFRHAFCIACIADEEVIF